MCKYNDIREQWRKEAKDRLAKAKLEEGVCLTLDNIQHMPLKERVKLAKNICDKEFR